MTAEDRPQGPAQLYRKTMKPELRAGMERFFSAITQADVDQVLADAYATLPDPALELDETELSFYQLWLNGTLNVMLNDRFFDEIYPQSTVAVDGLVTELSQMNHPDVWTGLLQKAEKKESVVAVVARELYHANEPVENLRAIGTKISERNDTLFGRSLVYTGIAVAYGSLFPELMSISEQLVMQVGTPHTIARYAFGVTLGKHFGTPAATPNEAVGRLQWLFPPRAATLDDIPAWHFVSDTSAFKEPYPGQTTSGFVECAGQGMTGKLFLGFGKLLAQDDFRQRVIARATKPLGQLSR